MPKDIRDKPFLKHEDILELNFISAPGIYHYRRHYRAGLRSHIMEVLNPEDVKKEKRGIILDGLKWFPKAKPLKMLRIFRTRFNSLKEAEEELRRVKIVETYLAPDHLAMSNEFLVDYTGREKPEFLLCGLQEYVEGEIVNPWSYLDKTHLISLFQRMSFEKVEDSGMIAEQWLRSVHEKVQNFTEKLREMIMKAGHVPDLAGIGNLILTLSGDIRLVDINNISKVSFDPTIYLDDRGYPVCDKSIEALFHLEQKLLGGPEEGEEIIYKTFLDPQRIKEVKAIERGFHLSTALQSCLYIDR